MMHGIYNQEKDKDVSLSTAREEKEEIDERVPSQTRNGDNLNSAASVSQKMDDQKNLKQKGNGGPELFPTIEEEQAGSQICDTQQVQPGAFKIPGPESGLHSDQTVVIGDSTNVESSNNPHVDPRGDQQDQDERRDLVIAAEVAPDEVGLHDRVHQLVQEALETRERSSGPSHSTTPDVAVVVADVMPQQPQESTGAGNKHWLRRFVIGSILICIIIIIAILLILLLPDDKNDDSTPPVTPDPTTAEPTTLEPSTNEPSTFEPTTPEPTTPEPTSPEPTTPEPTPIVFLPDDFHVGVVSSLGDSLTSYSTNTDPIYAFLRTSVDMHPPNLAVPFYRYDISWDGGSEEKPVALFGTLESTYSDKDELGFFQDATTGALRLDNGLYAFGISLDSTKATIGVYDDAEELPKPSNLRNVAYLLVENIPQNHGTILSGMVDPQGNIVSGFTGFFATKSDGSTNQDEDEEIPYSGTNRTYNILFHTPFDNPPTFVVFPIWYPSTSNDYPHYMGELGVGVNGCTREKCSLQLGSEKFKVASHYTGERDVEAESYMNQHLGFSFLALDGNFNDENGVIHGVINVVKTENNNYVVSVSSGKHFTATGQFSSPSPTLDIGFDTSSDYTFLLGLQIVGGVLIEFEQEFLDKPAIIVSPVLSPEHPFKSNTYDGLLTRFPTVLIEGLTSKQVFIKAGLLNTDNVGLADFYFFEDANDVYYPTSFHFTAIGPLAESS